jgi:DNA-binding NtrC family response regulator
MANKILVVDDDVAVTNYLMVFLMQTELWEPTVINDSREIPELLQREHFDAILLDINMPGLSGMDILKILREEEIDTPVVILTGFTDVDLAVQAMKLGAFDYLTKPVEDDHLLEVLDKALQHRTVHQTITTLPNGLKKEDLTFQEAFELIPTRDPAMIRLFHQAEKMAASDLSIFIWGERGTEKEYLARAMHSASVFRDGPFVAVNVEAQDPERFPADLFGQARDWSGTREGRSGFLEEAANGTLFLDKVEKLTIPVQLRLLRVIQAKEYYLESSSQIRDINVRIIVASRYDLTKDAYKDTFSRDLLFHLMVNYIQIPPLRQRKDDIPLLARRFLEQERQKTGKQIDDFSDDFIRLLTEYEFPGNTLELHDIVAASVVNEETNIITVDSLSPYMRRKLTQHEVEPEIAFIPQPLETVVHQHVTRTLDFFDGDMERAARELAISPDEMESILKDRQ